MKVACQNIFTCLLLLFVLLIQTIGQPTFKVQYYSAEHGLSHQAVTSILKDADGFMWFGTWDGINRFDGHVFVPHKSFPGDNSILGNGRIDQMVEDQAGHLWIEAYDKHIYCFDKKTEAFLPLSPIIDKQGKPKIPFAKILLASNGLVWLQSEREGIFYLSQQNFSVNPILNYAKQSAVGYSLPSDSINFFHEDKEHKIWIGTSSGLSLLIKNNEGIYKTTTLPLDIAKAITFTAFEEDAGHLYFSTANGKLITYNKITNSFQELVIANGYINAILKSRKKNGIYATTLAGEIINVDLGNLKIASTIYRSKEPLYKIFEDHAGFLWIEPEKRGVIRFNPQSNNFKSFTSKNNEGLNFIGNRFRVLEDNNNVLWVDMKGGGFGFYNAATDSIENLLFIRDASSYKLPDVVYTIYYDPAGVLWLTTNEREVIKIVSQGNDFKQQLLVSQVSSSVDNEVRGIFCDNQDRLWIGAKRGQMHIFQGDKKLTDILLNEPAEGLGGVYSILQDKHGNIWMGTKGSGLYKATPINPQQTKYNLTHFPIALKDGDGLPCKEIYSLIEDHQGRIWIGSFDKGLYVATITQDAVNFVHANSFYKNYPKENSNKIRKMAMDFSGNIWIGTTNGLLVLEAVGKNLDEQKTAFYTKIPGDAESLGNNDIQYVLCDSKNRIWIATSGGGLCLAVGNNPFQSLLFRNFTVKDGMPNNYVLACTEDKNANLWLSTENGICKFNPESQVFRNYNSYDGLPKVRFSEAAACQRYSDGKIYFGTNRGVISFAPKHINENRIAANIAFTNLQINNADSKPGINESVLKSNINNTAELTLKYNQNIISIDYAMLDYRAGTNQTFAYRLIGFDTTWHTDRQIGRATYTNLPPGKYVFEVKNQSNDQYVNLPYKSLQINILPPPWKTWWAYLLYFIAACVLLIFIRKYALRMARLRQGIAVERKLAALKLDFFTNVSHELRTPLTLIVGPLEQLLRKEKLTDEATSYVEVAHKNATRMVRFVNQLLDLRKVQSNKAVLDISPVELISFIGKIKDHFIEAAKAKELVLAVESEQKEIFAWVDADKLEVVIYNLISNAIKFSPAGKLVKISIIVQSEDQNVLIKVTDQGPGVAKEKLNQIFDVFYGGETTNGAPKGTGIGLSLSKELIELHGGKIWATNNETGGLTVSINLKLDAAKTEQLKEIIPTETDKTSLLLLDETTLQNSPINFSIPINEERQQLPLVLLVEDNVELRSFIKAQLSEFYRVETAEDGEDGFQKTITLLPDLVVSDIMMPKMDGIQMLDKIKNEVNTSHIPVVLLSAKYSIESQINGLSYGADYYITKPFNNEFLVASINNLLKQRKKLFQLLLNQEPQKEIAPIVEPKLITSKDEKFLKDVIAIVEEKMTDTNFNIETIAETMAMSRTTFYKKFKSLTGSTIVEFVRDIRLQKAKELLEEGESNISEVAYQTGFSSPNYFSTCFKEKYQVSPSEFVKSKHSV